MDKEEFLKKFNHNVDYLRRNVPPDDIYAFCEQTVMAAVYFLRKWHEWIDIHEEMESNPISKKWIVNIGSLRIAQEEDIDIEFDLKLDGELD